MRGPVKNEELWTLFQVDQQRITAWSSLSFYAVILLTQAALWLVS